MRKKAGKPKQTKCVKVSDEVKELLDKLRHPGQSYDGILRELTRDRILYETDTTRKDGGIGK